MNKKKLSKFVVFSIILGGVLVIFIFFIAVCFYRSSFGPTFGYEVDGIKISKTWGLMIETNSGYTDKGNYHWTKSTCEKAAQRYIKNMDSSRSSQGYVCMTECLPFHPLERINQMMHYQRYCKFYEKCDDSGCSELIKSEDFEETLEKWKEVKDFGDNQK